MPRGRPAKSIAQHRADGTYREDRHGERAAIEDALDGKLERPKHLDGEAKKHWDLVVAQLKDASIAKAIDQVSLLAMCEAWALYRKCYPLLMDNPFDKDLRITTYTALDRWNYFAQRFGLTPADRSKLKVESEEEAVDPFEHFMSQGGRLN